VELCAKHTIPVFRSPTSRKQPILPFDVRVSINTFQHNAGRDLAELFGFDFVEQVARTCGLGSGLFMRNRAFHFQIRVRPSIARGARS
jgi:hypothetical protein